MAEIKATPECVVGNANRFKEAVCIETERIFDSCSDRDCLENLQVFFSEHSQLVISRSAVIKCKSAEILDTHLSVEPVPFNSGYFAVDIAFYFRVDCSCYSSPQSTPANVRGLTVYTKKVILYGGEGGVKTFHSGERREYYGQDAASVMPTACLKAVDPVILGSRVTEDASSGGVSGTVPDNISCFFEGAIVTRPPDGSKMISVTLGLFTIVTLHRSVQLMIPVYDYVLPEKESVSSITANEPGELFRRIKFPVNEFFPEDASASACSCGE